MNKIICLVALVFFNTASLSIPAQPAASQSVKEYRVSLAGGNPVLAQKLSSELLALRDAAASGKSAVSIAERIAPHSVRQGKIQCIIE